MPQPGDKPLEDVPAWHPESVASVESGLESDNCGFAGESPGNNSATSQLLNPDAILLSEKCRSMRIAKMNAIYQGFSCDLMCGWW